ncbi:hypothetical protein GA0115256_128992, partial [Streptomyces sp. DconLS]
MVRVPVRKEGARARAGRATAAVSSEPGAVSGRGRGASRQAASRSAAAGGPRRITECWSAR